MENELKKTKEKLASLNQEREKTTLLIGDINEDLNEIIPLFEEPRKKLTVIRWSG